MPTAVVWPRPSRVVWNTASYVSVPERDTMPTVPVLKMLPGMMPILHAPAVITPGQFGPISRDFEPDSARFTLTMSATGMPSVMHTMSGNLRVDRLADGVGGARRRHVDDAGVGIGLGAGLGHCLEDRQAEMEAAAFAGRDAADHLGPVGDRLLGVEGAVLAGEPPGR